MSDSSGSPLCDYCDLQKGVVDTSKAGEYEGFFSPVWDMLKTLFNSFLDVINDVVFDVLCKFLDVALFAANLIELPIISGALQNAVSGLSPDISYLLTQTGFYEALVIVGGGYSFYLLRRLLTLGNW